jgi:hypothetical protein
MPRSEPLDVHLGWLGNALEPHSGAVHALMQSSSVRIFGGVIAEETQCRFRLSPGALAILVRLGVPLELSLIFLGPPESSIEVAEEPSAATTDVAPGGRNGPHRTESELRIQLRGTYSEIMAISDATGIVPSRMQHLDVVDPSSQSDHPDLWSFVTPVARGENLGAHFKWLAAALPPTSEIIHSVKRQAEPVVHCDFGTESDSGGVSIPVEGLKVCTELDAPLEFSARLM